MTRAKFSCQISHQSLNLLVIILNQRQQHMKHRNCRNTNLSPYISHEGGLFREYEAFFPIAAFLSASYQYTVLQLISTILLRWISLPKWIFWERVLTKGRGRGWHHRIAFPLYWTRLWSQVLGSGRLILAYSVLLLHFVIHMPASVLSLVFILGKRLFPYFVAIFAF